LRASGNGVCLQCHAAGKYDSPKHHFHKLGSTGARCVECHMPARTYMVIDARRDHSIRIPRLDLTITIGTPNACNQCHTDKSAQWASDSIKKWYGSTAQGFQSYAEVFHEASEGAPGAFQALTSVAGDADQPAIARATALARMADYAPQPDDPTVHQAVVDPSPLIRRSAAAALSNSDPAASAPVLSSLLADPVRSVRIETADVLAAIDPPSPALERAMHDYVDAQQLNADRPESHLNLAVMFAKQKKLSDAEAQLKQALSLDPSFTPAAVNLADLYRTQHRDAEGETILRTTLLRSPSDPSLLYALGLLMVRQGQKAKALNLLAEAAKGDPDNPHYAFVYAVALNDTGEPAAAIATLETSLKTHPYDRDSLNALIAYLALAGNRKDALEYARRLYELEPGNAQLRDMLSTENP
jgi:Flp pilus assembly protein TadD